MARFGFVATSGLFIAGMTLTLVAVTGGCQQVLGIVDLPIGEGGSHAGGKGGAGGMESSTSSSGSASGMGGMGSGSASATGAGGTGGAGSGGAGGGSSGGPTCFNCAAWSRTLLGANDQIINDVAVDSNGNVILVGSINGNGDLGANCAGGPCPLTVSSAPNKDIFIVKLNPDGSPSWVKVIGDMTDSQDATGVAIDKATDEIFVIGQFQGTIDFGNGPLTAVGDYDVFVAKLAPDGGPTNTWSKRFGDSVTQRGTDIGIDSAHRVIVTGYFKGGMSFGCSSMNAGNNSYNMFLAQLDNTGQCVWSKSYGDDPSGQLAYGLATGKDDKIFVTGECKGMIEGQDCGTITPDIFLAGFDANGTSLWAKHFGDEAHLNYGRGVATDENGDVYMTGEFQGMLDFKDGMRPMPPSADPMNLPDAFLSKFDAMNGKAIWTQWLQGDGAQIGHRAVVDNSNGRVFAAGKMDGSLSFGGKTLDPGGVVDMFVVSVDVMGNPQCGANYANFAGMNPSLALVESDGDLLLGFSFQNTVTVNCIQQPITGVAGADTLVAKIKF